MSLHEIQFIGGVVKAADVEKLPKSGLYPKVVFAGRSNVGKSSLLNSIAGKTVARVSSEPGKTREMNFFIWKRSKISTQWLTLVDLPGYGYAKVGADLKKQWGREITAWLQKDLGIALVVSLVDGRHGFLDQDVELVEFLQQNEIPFIVAFTKMDKYKSRNQSSVAERQLAELAKKLGVQDYVFVTSMKKNGTSDLEKKIYEVAQK